jgi:hypothetical protein
MTPEAGAQPRDGGWTHDSIHGKARLQEGQGNDVESESPLVKFARVWSDEYAGASSTERITGQP